MADTRTRIINLPEATTLDSSINFIGDSADGSGTRRVTYDTLKGAINQNLAPEYSSTATYAVGDLCTYKGTLYSCSTAISTAENWTAAHWTTVKVSAKISELKSTLDYISEDFVATNSKKIYQASANYRINPADGKSVFNADYKIVKYEVSAGEMIKVISDDYFQFQAVPNVPAQSSQSSNRIGKTYGQYDGFIIVPTGVNYIVFSTPANGSIVNCYALVSHKDKLSEYNNNAFEGVYSPEWIYYAYIDKYGTEQAHTSWCHTDYIPVHGKHLHFSLAVTRDIDYNSFYDAEKTWIGWFRISTGENIVEIPPNAAYVRVSAVISELSQYTWHVVNEASDALKSYEIYADKGVGGYVGTDGNIVESANWIYSDYIGIEGGLIIASNSSSDGSTHNAWYDDNKNFIANFSIYPNTVDAEIIAPNNAKYIRFSHLKTAYNSVKFSLNSKKTYYSGDILRLNDKDTVGQRIVQSKMHYNPYDQSEISTKILTLSVFTDIHAFTTEFKRYIRFTNAYQDYVDDRLCLGDVVRDNISQDFTYWSDNPDAGSILIALGNHDASTYENGQYIVQPALSCYNKFFKDLIGNWNVTQPTGAAESGLCYYYKDYTDSNLRLIVLDCMHYTDAQNDWLISTLASAKTAGLHVICAKHYNVSKDLTKVDGNFYNPDLGFGKLVIGDTNNNKAQAAVSDFQTAGGVFVCWLTGHTHYDAIGELTVDGHKQLCVAFENAGCHDAWGDDARVAGQKSEDSFNIVSVDTYSKLLKIVRVGNDMNRFMQSKQYMCYNYQTNEVISVN